MEGSGLANGVRAASDPDGYRDGAEERLLTVSARIKIVLTFSIMFLNENPSG